MELDIDKRLLHPEEQLGPSRGVTFEMRFAGAIYCAKNTDKLSDKKYGKLAK